VQCYERLRIGDVVRPDLRPYGMHFCPVHQ
jgi:hypothetical protein